MTTASRAVERLVSYSWNDWSVSMSEQSAAMAVLRTDPDLAATIRDLHASGMLEAVVNRLPAVEITQLLGGACDAGMKGVIRMALTRAEAQAGGDQAIGLGSEYDIPWLFDLSFEIQNAFRRMGAKFKAIPFSATPFAGLIPSAPDAPFSGAAATGTSGVKLRVPASAQALMLAGFRSTADHDQIAVLLTSEEVNIFGVAKYVRTVANRGAGLSLASMPNTKATFPKVNLGLLAASSTSWPDDNIRVLGMYYTSRAWTDNMGSAGWGDFVFEAYRDVRATGLFP